MPASTHGVSLSLTGKVALITGGSRGIGAAAVRMFCSPGAQVTFSYQKASQTANAVVAECGGDRCSAIQADLSSLAGAEGLIRATVATFGRLDLLVVNHGIWPPEDVAIDQMAEQQWRQTIGTNLDSVFGLIKHSVAQMKRQTINDRSHVAGRIVIISSTAGQRGEAFHCDYAATKGAVISMVKGLSTELARDGIYVNCVAPGWVATDMSAPAMADPKIRDRVFATIPLGRIGTPEEIAAPILFLCTEHAGFITGEILNVNGGAVLAG
ncbi:MAG: SDR family oxidoreductase [Acidobacteria bacterium]|nr:SDR family oxidoreductase [Acidobacteriota bacterium]